jgi:sugar phosphate isomerase/epimerase
MKFSVRVAYLDKGKDDWYERLKPFEAVGAVEVAFYRSELFLKNVRLEEVIEPFKSLKIKVSSIHMAQFRLYELNLFEEIFRRTVKIAEALNCKIIVIHPSKGEYSQIQGFISTAVDPVLKSKQIFLCWETFKSRKRIFGSIDEVYNFCKRTRWHRMCYDFSHVSGNQKDVLADITKYLDMIKVFHLSNRSTTSERQKSQHCPIFPENPQEKKEFILDFEEILSYLKEKSFSGSLTLEYLPIFHDRIIEDALKAKERYT